MAVEAIDACPDTEFLGGEYPQTPGMINNPQNNLTVTENRQKIMAF